jgi:archaellin
MRFVLAAIAATLIIGVATSTTSFAQKKKEQVRASVNECIQLARQRGYTDSDLSAGGAKSNPARDFVIRCLQGKQR